MQRMAGIVGVVGLALLLGGCGDGAAPTIGGSDGDGETAAPAAAPPACDELGEPAYDPPAEEQPPADPGLTDAQPRGDIDPVEDGDPMEQARRWAEQQAPEHFAGIWYEPAEGASVIAFTEDVDAYAAEVRERFGEGWWVVTADHSEAELLDLQGRIVEEQVEQDGRGEPQAGDVTGVGVRTNHGRVTVMLLEPSDERLAELGERYGTEALCVEVTPMPDEEHAQPAPWAPADDADLSADATSIDVLVNEVGCAGGAPADGRIAPPEIEYGDDEVVVTIAVIPRPGPQTCPGNPNTAYTLELDEPLRDRQLLDGAQTPPAEPALDRMPPDDLGDEERPQQDPTSSE